MQQCVSACKTALVLPTSLDEIIEVEEQDELEEGPNRSIETAPRAYIESLVLVRLLF